MVSIGIIELTSTGTELDEGRADCVDFAESAPYNASGPVVAPEIP